MITIARWIDRAGIRARMYALRVETVNDLERQRDDARESRDRLIDRVATVVTERDELKRTCDRAREMADGVRAELRASGYPDLAEGHLAVDLGRAVDTAIDRERSKAQDFLEELAAALEAPPCHRTQGTHVWPTDGRELLKLAGRRTNAAEQWDRHTSAEVKPKRGAHTPEFTGQVCRCAFDGRGNRDATNCEIHAPDGSFACGAAGCASCANPPRRRGLEVDGDVLARAIRLSMPKSVADSWVNELIDGIFDQAIERGMTVLHGATGEQVPRMSREQRETVPF